MAVRTSSVRDLLDTAVTVAVIAAVLYATWMWATNVIPVLIIAASIVTVIAIYTGYDAVVMDRVRSTFHRL